MTNQQNCRARFLPGYCYVINIIQGDFLMALPQSFKCQLARSELWVGCQQKKASFIFAEARINQPGIILKYLQDIELLPNSNPYMLLSQEKSKECIHFLILLPFNVISDKHLTGAVLCNQ